MTTPKPFNPVVPLPEPAGWLVRYGTDNLCWNAYRDERTALDVFVQWGGTVDTLYTLAQLREYAASVAREMVPDESVLRKRYPEYVSNVRLNGFEACRAAALSAIDEWEKGE